MIDNIEGFIKDMFRIRGTSSPGSVTGGGGGGTSYFASLEKDLKGNMYCPKCFGERRMGVSLLYSKYNFMLAVSASDVDLLEEAIKNRLILSLWDFKCTQCDTSFTVLYYEGVSGVQMAVLPSCDGGIVTPNTPSSVAYYLDQAYRAKSIGANSACIAMYRGALEQLMYQQGYQNGMLNGKIRKLEEEVTDGIAPKWANELGTKFLFYIKELGNGAIHPNDGNIEKQKELDNQLIEVIDVVFAKLLDKIYEEPNKELERDNILEEKLKHFERK